MSKEDEYRGFAASCLDLAKSSSTPDEKMRLLAMAEAWLNLADRAAQRAKSPMRALADHPLVAWALRRGVGAA